MLFALYTVAATVAGFKAQATAPTHGAADNQLTQTQQQGGFQSSGLGVTQNVLLVLISAPVQFGSVTVRYLPVPWCCWRSSAASPWVCRPQAVARDQVGSKVPLWYSCNVVEAPELFGSDGMSARWRRCQWCTDRSTAG
jgi:hypothetical protein